MPHHTKILDASRTCILLLATVFLISCNPTRKLLPGQYLVNKVEVVNNKETHIAKEQFEAFYRQKPNRKLLGTMNFFVWWYNLFDQKKIARKREQRNLKYDRINSKRILKHEKKLAIAKREKKKLPTLVLKDKESPMLIENIRDIGEPPVTLDSALMEQTRLQLSRFLFSHGFFNNEVTDSVVVNRKKQQRVTVIYNLHPGKAYYLNEVALESADTAVGKFVMDTVYTRLRAGMRYDEEKFQATRARITEHLLNNGYYYFENAYVDYNVDTAFNNHTAKLTVRIKKFARPYSSSNDSLIYENHPQLRVQNVYVVTEPVVGNIRDAYFSDTIYARKSGIIFLLNQPLKYKRSLLSSNIGIRKGQLFKKDTANITYRSLIGLGIFKNVTINFLVNAEHKNALDCYIVCSPLIKQSITAEPQLTNTSGNLGIDASLVYQNKNLLRGGELLEFRIQGALIAQTQFNSQYTQKVSGDNLSVFNTIQIGPQVTLSFPRAIFPFSVIRFPKEYSPRTYIKASYNFQSRNIFNRTISAIDYGFNFKTRGNTIRHDITPIEIYFVKANLTQQFKQDLAKANDAFLTNSFQDHVTTLSRYVFTFTSKENAANPKKTLHYLRFSAASSGNLLRMFFDNSGRTKDSLNRYLVFNIPFAQFVRGDIDYRIYIPIRKKSRVVYRVAGGIGLPLTNLSVLPYEQSYFSGGPNSVRAWRARSLGPGSYNPETSTALFDKIGDLLLEGNFEYRFHIIRDFNGALFVDAGNIWRLKADESKPGGEFHVSSFIDQIAIGGGFGIRWDLSFIVIRLDLAVPLKDPKLDVKNRWTFIDQPKEVRPLNRIVANFGIGYPF